MGDNDVERGAGIFCKIIIVCFLSVRYRSDGLYYKMAGTLLGILLLGVNRPGEAGLTP